MSRAQRKFLLIPVWLLTLILQPLLPKTHPWRYEKLTLNWWADCASHFTLTFSGFCYWHALCVSYVLYRLWYL